MTFFNAQFVIKAASTKYIPMNNPTPRLTSYSVHILHIHCLIIVLINSAIYDVIEETWTWELMAQTYRTTPASQTVVKCF